MTDWLTNSPRIRLRKSSVLRDPTGLQMIASPLLAHRPGARRRSAGDDNRTSALLILASSVDPNLGSTCDCVVLSCNHPQPHDQAQKTRPGGGRIGVL